MDVGDGVMGEGSEVDDAKDGIIEEVIDDSTFDAGGCEGVGRMKPSGAQVLSVGAFEDDGCSLRGFVSGPTISSPSSVSTSPVKTGAEIVLSSISIASGATDETLRRRSSAI